MGRRIFLGLGREPFLCKVPVYKLVAYLRNKPFSPSTTARYRPTVVEFCLQTRFFAL